MCLIAGLSAPSAGAAEKIQFSSGNKGGKKENLAVQSNKPALPTLDFNRMGGRGSKAEELAPMTPLPESPLPEENLATGTKKQDKDWLNPENKQDRDGKGNKAGQDRDKSNEKDRDENKKRNELRESDNDLRNQKENDPLKREENRDPLFRLNNSGSSTNKIVFGASDRREDQTFQAQQSPGAPLRTFGAPRGAGPNPMEEQSRSSALERLGFAQPKANGPAGVGSAANNSSILGIGGNQSMRDPNNGTLSPLIQSGGARDSSIPGGMRPPDSGFRSSLMNNTPGMNLGPEDRQPRASEPPPSARKPAVLPVPQRKF